jgi:hypothetical protein
MQAEEAGPSSGLSRFHRDLPQARRSVRVRCRKASPILSSRADQAQSGEIPSLGARRPGEIRFAEVGRAGAVGADKDVANAVAAGTDANLEAEVQRSPTIELGDLDISECPLPNRGLVDDDAGVVLGIAEIKAAQANLTIDIGEGVGA